MQVLYPASLKAGTDLQVRATVLLSTPLRYAEVTWGRRIIFISNLSEMGG